MIGEVKHSPSPRQFAAVSVLLLVVTLLAYWPALNGGMLWDDAAHITKPSLRSADGLDQIWTDPRATQQYYPLSHTAFWLMWWSFGERTLGYHLVNVVLHALNAALVWLVLRRLALDPRASLLASLVFALHPVNVESVAWMTELKNTLSTCFFLLATLTWLPLAIEHSRSIRFHRWLLTFVLFTCALASKSFTASWPAAMLVLVWWQRGRISIRRDVLALVPFFVAGIAMGTFTMAVEREIFGAQGESFSLTIAQRIIVAGRAVWFYFATLVWPVNLMFFYPRWEIVPTSAWQWLWPLGALLLLVALWLWRNTIGRGPLAAALLFGGTLLPALGFFNLYWHLYTFVCDHMLYLPAIPLMALLCTGVVKAIDASHAPTRLLLPLIVLTLATLTWNRSRTFTDSITLWQDTIRRNPECWMAWNNLGIDLMRQNQPGEAASAFERAIAIKPDHASAHANLAGAYLSLGQPALAIDAANAALNVRPLFVEPYLHLAQANIQLGRYEASADSARHALKLNPNVAAANHWLGLALQNLGLDREAAAAFERALALEPDHPDFLNNFAWLLATSPDSAVVDGPRAVNLATRALAMASRPETLGVVAAACARAGDFSCAVSHANRAIEAAEAAGNAGLAQSTRQRLAAYNAGRPWTETPPPSR